MRERRAWGARPRARAACRQGRKDTRATRASSSFGSGTLTGRRPGAWRSEARTRRRRGNRARVPSRRACARHA
eukprot:1495469-Pyramimonas_sp.AAC.1